ncbi:hypothetical protein [Planktothricoides raciborskii]|uniref:Uncharacterized protein n=1 Tax=Planktothricoides raciborskii GIHE-MW2 TaxID=2792601 RepID=A0AAU8JLL0_9CYAN
MFKHPRGLEIAEYISLAGAVTGTILATVFGDFTYAAWPICFAILLNTINRRYGLNQDWHSRRTIAQLEEKIAALSLKNIDAAKVQSPEQFNLTSNAESMKAIASLIEAVQKLRSQQQQLHGAIKQIKDQLNTLSQQFKDRPELEQIESLTQVIVALQQLIDDFRKVD